MNMREVLLYLVALIFLLSGLSHALERESPETYELLRKEEERPKVIEEGEMEEEEREEEEEEPSTI
ncbi:MAG TPA: hypothetical protein EYH49_00825, partial [Aquifex aeolicus]|nr:hypothetical protein [Aquifex aeolicus]